MAKTGIYRADPIGNRVEVSQKNIDYWCNMCQFPIETSRCQDSENIQRCWNECGSVAGIWHIGHECPFAHINKPCKCNDYKTTQEAFVVCGLEYNNA